MIGYSWYTYIELSAIKSTQNYLEKTIYFAKIRIKKYRESGRIETQLKRIFINSNISCQEFVKNDMKSNIENT